MRHASWPPSRACESALEMRPSYFFSFFIVFFPLIFFLPSSSPVPLRGGKSGSQSVSGSNLYGRYTAQDSQISVGRFSDRNTVALSPELRVTTSVTSPLRKTPTESVLRSSALTRPSTEPSVTTTPALGIRSDSMPAFSGDISGLASEHKNLFAISEGDESKRSGGEKNKQFFPDEGEPGAGAKRARPSDRSSTTQRSSRSSQLSQQRSSQHTAGGRTTTQSSTTNRSSHRKSVLLPLVDSSSIDRKKSSLVCQSVVQSHIRLFNKRSVEAERWRGGEMMRRTAPDRLGDRSAAPWKKNPRRAKTVESVDPTSLWRGPHKKSILEGTLRGGLAGARAEEEQSGAGEEGEEGGGARGAEKGAGEADEEKAGGTETGGAEMGAGAVAPKEFKKREPRRDDGKRCAADIIGEQQWIIHWMFGNRSEMLKTWLSCYAGISGGVVGSGVCTQFVSAPELMYLKSVSRKPCNAVLETRSNKCKVTPPPWPDSPGKESCH